jgi:hypothetical protein
MTRETSRMTVSNDPTLLRLAEEVRRSQRPTILRSESGEDLAMVVPMEPANHAKPARTARLKPTTREELDAIFAAAPTLPEPRSWEEIKQIAQEDASAGAVRGW